MMQAADEIIVVADSSKFGHRSLMHLCPLDNVDCVVTDDGLSPEWRTKIDALGVRLIVATVSENGTAEPAS
jgi:DeoR family ulaG and ulaABCDEF operon transcriptional repressor